MAELINMGPPVSAETAISPLPGTSGVSSLPQEHLTSTNIPTVDVDFDQIKDQLFIPNSGEPISTSIDPSVIKNANILARTLTYNPVVMNYPYEMDPNSALFNQENLEKNNTCIYKMMSNSDNYQ